MSGPGQAPALSARSIIASTLLGTHPPAMAGRLLVALASRFGVAEGTVRVALSRMVERGELRNDDGTYALTGHLLARQQRQDRARTPRTRPWDGSWEQAVVTPGASANRRSERRSDLTGVKLAELREGVWLRPANLDPDRLDDAGLARAEDILWADIRPLVDPATLAARLWDLDAWAAQARALTDAIEASSRGLDADDDAMLGPGFELSAAVLRHLVADPELPPELAPPNWPAPRLRDAYDQFDLAYRRLLRRFFHQETHARS